MLPLGILLSSIDRLWIGSAADYLYRVGVPDKVGIRIPHSTQSFEENAFEVLGQFFGQIEVIKSESVIAVVECKVLSSPEERQSQHVCLVRGH